MQAAIATSPNHSESYLPDAETTGEVRALRHYVTELRDLQSAISLLSWDQQTKMPPKAAEGRGRSLGALGHFLHDRRIAPEFEQLIIAVEDQDAASAEVRVCRRAFNLDAKLPPTHVRERSEAASSGYAAWQQARRDDDFATYLPHLDRLLDLARREAELYGYEDEPYDALHDLYEEGSRAADLEPMFAALREPIQTLLDQQPEPDTSVLERTWDIGAQEHFSKEVVARMGYDFDAGRLDETAHPFCAGIGTFDTRITTRYDENWLPTALFGTIHEAGHGIYDQSFNRLELPSTLASAPGLGMHESQSRGFENVIGRSRPFWEHWYPRLQHHFPEATTGVDLDTFLRQVNTAQRTFIRVEADELSYNLHLAVRFELERALVNGDLAPKDLPEAWNEAFERWFGMRPTSNRDGVLQDVHWSSGSFGYFPTYTLGNIYAAQFTEAARRDLPNWDDLLRSGDTAPIVAWFDEHVYRHGCAYTGREFVQRITGGPVDVAPLVRYLQSRFG